MKIYTLLTLLFLGLFQLKGQNLLPTKDWHDDLDFLQIKLEERHANLFHTCSKEDFLHGINKLKSLSDSISEKELIIRISELIAQVGDAHTFLDFRNQDGFNFQRIPLDVYPFEDGLFVTKAPKEYQEYIGSEIISINGITIDSIFERVKNIGYNENEFTKLISVSRFIVYPEVLKRFKFIENADSVTLEMNKSESSRVLKFKPVDKDSIKWISAHNKVPGDLPIAYRNNDSIFWYSYEKENKLLYVQLNRCTENNSHKFETLSDEIVKITSERAPRRLVLDLRRNIGGNSALTYPLIYALSHYEKKVPEGQIFVITGRLTLSASIVLCAEIRKYCKPIFIGEPTGAAPNLYGENSYWLTLPNSQLKISYSSEWFQPAGPFVKDNWVSPDIYLPVRSEAFFKLEEPILDRVRNYSKDKTGFTESIYNLAMQDRIKEAIAFYEQYKSNPENKYQNTMTSIRRMANRIGREGKMDYSLKFHELNVRDNPMSAHAMLNLAQVIEDINGKENARSFYMKSNELLTTDRNINAYLKHYFEDYIAEILNQ